MARRFIVQTWFLGGDWTNVWQSQEQGAEPVLIEFETGAEAEKELFEFIEETADAEFETYDLTTYRIVELDESGEVISTWPYTAEIRSQFGNVLTEEPQSPELAGPPANEPADG